MHSVFVYGTLMFPDVLEIILGRPFSKEHVHDAVLKDYRRIGIPEKVYPTGIGAPGHQIRGKLLTGLTNDDLLSFDAYEESFYRRISVSVDTAKGIHEAFVYIDGRSPLPFTIAEWDPKVFQERHLRTFLKALGTKWRANERTFH